MAATHTSDRIRKLIRKGLSDASIARKIGRAGAEGEQRVRDERAAMERESRPDPIRRAARERRAGPLPDRRQPRGGSQLPLRRRDPDDA